MAHDKAYTFVAALLRRSKNRTATNLDHYAKRSNVFVLAWLKRAEPAVKEGVFDSIDQMRNNSIQSKCKSFPAVIARYEFKH